MLCPARVEVGCRELSGRLGPKIIALEIEQFERGVQCKERCQNLSARMRDATSTEPEGFHVVVIAENPGELRDAVVSDTDIAL